MLGDATVVATIAVNDLALGKEFYGETLGLTQADEDLTGVTYASGDSQLHLYESSNAGTNKATCAVWQVDDVPGRVEQLKAKGIQFEHYDLPGTSLQGDIHVMGVMQAAWFKDPDGNILCIANG